MGIARLIQENSTTEPIGAIKTFGYEIADPSWLLCDGSDINASKYPELAKKIGGNYSKAVVGDIKDGCMFNQKADGAKLNYCKMGNYYYYQSTALMKTLDFISSTTVYRNDALYDSTGFISMCTFGQKIYAYWKRRTRYGTDYGMSSFDISANPITMREQQTSIGSMDDSVAQRIYPVGGKIILVCKRAATTDNANVETKILQFNATTNQFEKDIDSQGHVGYFNSFLVNGELYIFGYHGITKLKSNLTTQITNMEIADTDKIAIGTEYFYIANQDGISRINIKTLQKELIYSIVRNVYPPMAVDSPKITLSICGISVINGTILIWQNWNGDATLNEIIYLDEKNPLTMPRVKRSNSVGAISFIEWKEAQRIFTDTNKEIKLIPCLPQMSAYTYIKAK